MEMADSSELWKVFPDFPRYEVSTHGRIRRIETGYIMKPTIEKYGYSQVTLSPGHKSVRVCRAVALTFLPNVEAKPQVNHIDANRSNDRLSNLEWVTASENVRHCWKIGNHSAESMGRARASIPDEDVQALRSPSLERGGVAKFARKYGITRKSASRIRTGAEGVYGWVK